MSSASVSADPLATAAAELLQSIRLRFYAQRSADYHRDRRGLLHAVTWPATWLDERGLTCSPQRYQTLIDQRLHAITAHGDPLRYGGYFPSFNLADSAITLGAICLIVDELRRVRRSPA